MRRRRPVVASSDGKDMPRHLAEFDPVEWPGRSSHSKVQAWKVARRAWVDEFHATGLDPLVEATLTPDELLDSPDAL